MNLQHSYNFSQWRETLGGQRGRFQRVNDGETGGMCDNQLFFNLKLRLKGIMTKSWEQFLL